MSDPVVHIQLLDDVGDEVDEDVVGLGLVKQFLLVQSLDVEVSVDWNLNYSIYLRIQTDSRNDKLFNISS